MATAQQADHRRVEYMPLSAIARAERNPKQHDEDGIRASLARWGVADLPVLDERTGRLVSGHGRLDQVAYLAQLSPAALAELVGRAGPPNGIQVDPESGEWLLPVARGWASTTDAEAEAYLLAANQLTIAGGWDDGALAELLADLSAVDPGLLTLAGFTDNDLAAILAGDQGGGQGPAGHTEPDAIPDVPDVPRTRPGDLWLLGPHRVLCGDSTDPGEVAHLVGGSVVTLIHADPPYGMGKEREGVANDNLYGADLDAFQMLWWSAWLAHLAGNGSVYIWGNAPDLWRLWWTGGLGADPDLMARNEIVWDKRSTPGMSSAGEHSYPTATERCLLIMRGEQFLGNQNKDDYWEGYEPLRLWLVAERDRAGITNRDVNRITGTSMANHWFSQSQFAPIGRKHYETLRAATGGRSFSRDYDDLFDEMFPGSREGGNAHRRSLSAQLRERRSYFDNTHDAMTDVWVFPRVVGDERYSHATPKPVAMVERALRTSSRPGDVVAVPFGGTGPELIAGTRLGRSIVAAELEPRYVDVMCRRWQEHTLQLPVLAATGEAHDFTQAP